MNKGDRVSFKYDIEGDGIIIDILSDRFDRKDYVIGNYPRPTYEPWHPRAMESYPGYNGLVVIVDQDRVRPY